MRRFFKVLILVLLSLFVLIQLYPRSKKNNNNAVTENAFSLTNTPPAYIQDILKTSCDDCHSNHTTYPWYANVQPIAWWLGDHIEHGKKELNLSEFGTYSLRKKYRKLEEMYSEVQEDKMPLTSYTRIHRDAILDANEKQVFLEWISGEITKMETLYPIDSLKKKR